MIFHEWMEFSPFEIGLPKYGTFMKTEQFSCKFFMGSMIREFPEPPLHFLQGIWGSAFCIQFKRLFQDDKNVDTAELMRREREELEEELKKDIDACDVEDSESSDEENVNEKGTHGEKTTGGLQRRRSKSTRLKQKSFWDSMVTRMLESRWFQSIELRAAQVFNFMRGLSLSNNYPFSPFTQTQEEEDESNTATFGSIFDLHPTHIKKLYVVDSGLTFNSPFPVILRPQREVDIILSFDFSARPTDDTPPFKELLLAAKWAELNKIPFPPIDPTVVQKEGLKECYVFKHPWDPNCPIVLHFCLVNINFKREIAPGVARTTQEELNFGNFSIFDDSAHPYSTFKFTYTHLEFDRLSKLMEYNTLLCKDIIFDNIGTCIKRRRRFSIRRPCAKNDIARLSLRSKAKAEKLLEYLSMIEKVSNINENDENEQNRVSENTTVHRKNGQPNSSPCKSRPMSSPVNFLESETDSDEETMAKFNKIQRSSESVRENMERRRIMSSTMSQVEEVDEQEESSTIVSTKNATPTAATVAPINKKPLLSRSRAVTTSMRPGLPTGHAHGIESDLKSNAERNTVPNNNVKIKVHEQLQNSSQSTCPTACALNGEEIEPTHGQDQSCVFRKTALQVSRKPLSSDTHNRNGQTGVRDAVYGVMGKAGISKMADLEKSVEDWIDAADRVTDL